MTGAVYLLTQADVDAIRDAYRAAIFAAGYTLDTLPQRFNEAVSLRIRKTGLPTPSAIARRYGINNNIVGAIGRGHMTAPPKRWVNPTVPGPRHHLTLKEYQEIRATWRNNLRALGFNPDRLPPDFSNQGLQADLRELGLPCQRDLADKYRTSVCTISQIVTGKRIHRSERKRLAQLRAQQRGAA